MLNDYAVGFWRHFDIEWVNHGTIFLLFDFQNIVPVCLFNKSHFFLHTMIDLLNACSGPSVEFQRHFSLGRINKGANVPHFDF